MKLLKNFIVTCIDPGETYTQSPYFFQYEFPDIARVYRYISGILPLINKKYYYIGSVVHNFGIVCIILDETSKTIFMIDKRGLEF